jgi:hypothetical protein
MSQNQAGTISQEHEVPLAMFSHDDKISYWEYQREVRPPIELLIRQNNDQIEDCD